jgi:hypothetical protein
MPHLSRIRAILLAPRETWPQIAAEPGTLRDLYLYWILWLAAIPPIAGAIGIALFWQRIFVFAAYLPGFSLTGWILRVLLLGYVFQVLEIAILAWIVQALAQYFQAQGDLLQATRSIAYAFTPVWLAGIFQIFAGTAIPALISLIAGIYGLYLLYLSLPFTLRCPADKTAPYFAVIVVAAILLSLLSGALIGGF